MKNLKYLLTFFILCSLSYVLFILSFENRNIKHKTEEENLSQYHEKENFEKEEISSDIFNTEKVRKIIDEENDNPIINTQTKEKLEEFLIVNTFNLPSGEDGNMIRLINEARVANNLNQLFYDPTLDSIADIRLNEVSIYFSHTRPDGSPFYTLSSAIDGENLSKYGSGDATSSFNGFMNSQDHRENILYSGFTRVSCKKMVIDDIVYWIQLFGY